MAGLLSEIFSAGNVAKRKLTDLLGNPLESAQQILGNMNDRARVLNEMTAAAAREGVAYGPASQQLGGLLSEAYNPAGLTVFHGSPYPFKKFDPTKIGSGEGAQAYGYGHYTAESPVVAKSYREALSEPELYKKGRQVKTSAGSNMDTAKAWLQDSFESGASNPFEDAIAKVAASPIKQKEEVISALQKLQSRGVQMQKGGFEYKIDLPDEQIAKMLDWDKPLSEQKDLVKNITPESLGLQYTRLENGNHAFVNASGEIIGNLQKGGTQEGFTKNWLENTLNGTGRDLYNQLGQGMGGGVKTSEALRQAGIPGIRYLDEGSRGNFKAQTTYKGEPYGDVVSFATKQQLDDYITEKAAEGFGVKTFPQTSNFVVFPGNEDLLKILERNNQPLGLLE